MGVAMATTVPLIPCPEPEKIRAIIERTGYQLEVALGAR